MKLYATLIEPHATNPEQRNRELVLNYVLLGLIFLTSLEFTDSLFGFLVLGQHYIVYRLVGIASLLVALGILYWFARQRQQIRLTALILVIALFSLVSIVILEWGVLTPTGILLFGLVIVMAGILLGSRYALYSALLSTVALVVLEYLKAQQLVTPNLMWMQRPSSLSDVVGFSTIYAVMALILWLYNVQMERSLERARASEAALSRQKDSLARTVRERTRELEAAQLEKFQQIYRFAELGRISSALFHDLANHLTSVSLDIEGLGSSQKSVLLDRVQEDIGYIDDVVQRVRLQLRGQGSIERFKIVDEINKVTKILRSKLVQARINLTITAPAKPIYFNGDIIPFRQIITNLISNAIDAYTSSTSSKPKVIAVDVGIAGNQIIISVTDWGVGIKPISLGQIFQPFYSSKMDGTGIGLFIVKQIVENDLKGTIVASSSPKNGTNFTVTIPRLHEKALNYLQSQQKCDGSFVSSSSHTTNPWEPEYHYSTTFVPALILNCLAGSSAQDITKPLAEFILSQKSPNWSFNYWRRASKEMSQFPYPDDLDDTFCALIGLYKTYPLLIGGGELAKIVHLLLTTETKVGGPYKTWLANPESPLPWHNVDIGVNANIAYFLQLTGSNNPILEQYLGKAIMNDDFKSDYYPSPFPVWYYLARICPNTCREKLRTTILKSLTPKSNSLELALAINALYELGATPSHITPLVSKLAEQQQADGSWPAAAFCRDPSRGGREYFHGSSALTTAFAIEALIQNQQSNRLATHRQRTNYGNQILESITRQANQDFSTLQADLQHHAKTILNKTLGQDDTHDITLLPYWFAQSLRETITFDKDLFINLGLANLYGWMAYTIYDDFLDDAGMPVQLPAANVFQRLSLDYFTQALPNNQSFRTEVRQTFLTMDGADTWEIANCRNVDTLPNYSDLGTLADRSLGHTLSPLAVLLQTGRKLDDPDVIATRQALRHYLIARQINDDAHDWQEDLSNRQVSYAVTQVLHDQKGYPQNDARHTFWHRSLPTLCDVILQQTAMGKLQLNKTRIFKPSNVVSKLLSGIEESARATRNEQIKTIQFLNGFDEIIK